MSTLFCPSLLRVFASLLCVVTVQASVTVYGPNGVQEPLAGGGSATATESAPIVTLTSLPAFNNIVLQPPPLPQPPPPTQFGLSLQTSAASVSGLSIRHNGTFLGFSIEFSVVDQVIGINSSFINVEFLNLMALVSQRSGGVAIRIGGNSQETATLVDSLPDNKIMEKDKADSSNPTETPALLFTPELLYMLNNVSALVGTKWYLGIPFNDTSNLRLQIAEFGESILGNNLLGFQLGNEPDLYAAHQHRPQNYSQQDYFNDFGVVVAAIANDPNIPIRDNLIAPSVSGTWSPESVFDTGFITTYDGALGALAVEHYPADNCAAAFPGSEPNGPINPQDIFANYLNHSSGIDIVSAYINSAGIAQQSNKPFLMFETNSASCGGFPGVSDSFGAALWAVDYGLQMAYSNFSGALLHVGGVDDTYNPFTPPPTNVSTFDQWTVGAVFYSTLVVAEALGNSGTAQIIDMQANGNNIFTPAYAIYENDDLARVLLMNYMTDPSGASTYTANLSFAGGTVPSQVSVKYLLAPSVSEKTNITWAAQTFGGTFESDGRLQGSEDITSVPCDQGTGTCAIQVPAPGVALVFLTPASLQEVSPSSTQTFSTSAVTKTMNTATVPASVLATSNGENGAQRKRLAGTSKGSSGASSLQGYTPSVSVVLLAVFVIALLSGIEL